MNQYNMNRSLLVNYYLNNQNEFIGENGHDKLLVGLKKFVKPIVSKSKIVALDVGCCIGDYIPHLNAICMEENKKILCFEPNPVNIAVLEPKINQDKNIKLLKHCISNETTTTSFYNWKDSDSNTAGNGIAGLRSGGSKICEVDVKMLDNVLDEEFKNEDIIIKFIKIDTEGNDSNVLKGFQKYMSKTKYIIFECSDCLDDIRGPGITNPMKDIVDFLSVNGFDTYRIGTKKLFKVNDEYWNQVYDDVKFWSNCFSLKKDDDLIHQLIDKNFDYKF
jgi:FkbM family methyltransferase